MDTLLLNLDGWDLCVDARGNIAMASDTYSLSQDAASAIKLFLGEYIYNTSLGIPYFEQILGKHPPANLVKSLMIEAALTVPGVVSADVFFSSVSNRQVIGQVRVADLNGNISTASF